MRFSFRLVVGEEDTKVVGAANNDHITQLFSQSKRLLEKTRMFISLQEMNRETEDNLYEVQRNIILNKKILLFFRKILKSMKELFWQPYFKRLLFWHQEFFKY